MTYFIGIDPGIKGAIAILDGKNLLYYGKLPTRIVWGSNVTDYGKTAEIIFKYCSPLQTHLLIERVTSYKQGSKSAFNFGANSLGLANFFLTLGLKKINAISPQMWKKQLSLSSNKEASIALVKKLFPNITKNISHDEAESVLLAFICSHASNKSK